MSLIHSIHAVSSHPIPSHPIIRNLLPNRHPTRLVHIPLRPRSNPRHLLRVLLINTGAPLQQTLLDRTTRLTVRDSRSQRRPTGGGGNASPAVLAVGLGARVGILLREVRDGVWGGVGVAQAADQGVVGFARFGQGVVARVEVFALFQLGLEEVFLAG